MGEKYYRCINCGVGNAFFKEKYNQYICNNCQFVYPIIEGVVLAIKEQYDFYNYKRKLSRYIKNIRLKDRH